MKANRSMVLSMRLSVESGKRLKRMANRHGWTPSDASARLVEEGLRRSEFAFVDFRNSSAGRQAYIQGSTLAVWEIMLLVRSYMGDVPAVGSALDGGFPGWKLHPLKGDLKGPSWSLTVTGNWRLIFHYDERLTNTASDIDLIDYH
jgi:hypothetical protein